MYFPEQNIHKCIINNIYLQHYIYTETKIQKTTRPSFTTISINKLRLHHIKLNK